LKTYNFRQSIFNIRGDGMAANKQQGQSFGLFLIGLTVLCAGFLGGGAGKLALIVGIVLLAVSFVQMLRIKPLEGKVANGPQSPAMKLVGMALAILGWVVVLFGMHIASGVGGRMVLAILGIVISLVGVLGILPAACNKNAIWKA
jgi:hypothetical protein